MKRNKNIKTVEKMFLKYKNLNNLNKLDKNEYIKWIEFALTQTLEWLKSIDDYLQS